MKQLSIWLGALAFLFLTVYPLRAQAELPGKKIYATYCAGCHGDTGRGDGPAARSLPVKPADHTDGAVMNKFSDKFLSEIITKGGSAVGKSAFMPGWGSQLKEKQLQELLSYLRSLAKPPYKPTRQIKK